MDPQAEQIGGVLHDYYGLDLDAAAITDYLDTIRNGQQFFPADQQQALLIKLLFDWESRQDKKIIIATSEACRLQSGTCVITFGVLSVDWPGLFDTCTGVVHEMGWNIYFVKGISMERNRENLGIVLIGVKVDKEEDRQGLLDQRDKIIAKIHQAAVGTSAKTYLLAEEFRKLEIYSQVIAYIEKIYEGDGLEAIIGMHGEAVKYFAARSRDYIENRKIPEIARQIILNHDFIEKAHASGAHIELDIANFMTEKEGEFTGVTVAGPAHMLYLEDCLKTIELTSPRFILKHNREFTNDQGISVFRIEFVDSTNHALTPVGQQRLKDGFSKMVLNKQRDRAQWIESIGGFEQYARAIIPLLVKEAQATGNTQVYQSVSQATELFIDFKVIVVVPQNACVRRKLVTDTINNIESVAGLRILAIKPPKHFGQAEVFIIDLRAHLTAIENTETIYQTIKDRIHEALGDFRDFDEGMRTLDTAKLKAIRQRLSEVDKSTGARALLQHRGLLQGQRHQRRDCDPHPHRAGDDGAHGPERGRTSGRPPSDGLALQDRRTHPHGHALLSGLSPSPVSAQQDRERAGALRHDPEPAGAQRPRHPGLPVDRKRQGPERQGRGPPGQAAVPADRASLTWQFHSLNDKARPDSEDGLFNDMRKIAS